MDTPERPQDIVPGMPPAQPPGPPVQMQAGRIPPCAACGGQRVGNLDLTGAYQVGLHPSGKTLWARPLSTLNAVVCLNCGLTSFYATDLGDIRTEAQQSPHLFSW